MFDRSEIMAVRLMTVVVVLIAVVIVATAVIVFNVLDENSFPGL